MEKFKQTYFPNSISAEAIINTVEYRIKNNLPISSSEVDRLLETLPPRLQCDEQFYRDLFDLLEKYVHKSESRSIFDRLLNNANLNIKNNKEIALKACKLHGRNLQYCSALLRMDEDVIEIALKSCLDAIQYAYGYGTLESVILQISNYFFHVFDDSKVRELNRELVYKLKSYDELSFDNAKSLLENETEDPSPQLVAAIIANESDISDKVMDEIVSDINTWFVDLYDWDTVIED